jgi:enolase 1/2/3
MNRSIIKDIQCRTIFDSRGVETIEVDVYTESGQGRVAAPFGAPGSRGEFEAQAYSPKGIQHSVEIVMNQIKPALVGLDALNLHEIDLLIKKIDGTPNYDKIGGNTSVTVSTAVAKAAAKSCNCPLFKFLSQDAKTLPLPLGNIIGGGAHSCGPVPDMQEHLTAPIGAKTVRQAVELNLEVHKSVKSLLESNFRNFVGGTDDENAWVADLDDFTAFEVLEQACKQVEDRHGVEVRMGLDLAADRLWDYDKKSYNYQREGLARTTEEQVDYLASLIERFRLFYVEDCFNSNDYQSFAKLKKIAGHKCLICADDLFATNIKRTLRGIELNAANSMIVKPNQVGTISEAMRTNDVANKNGIHTIISHRSGETIDDSIAHIAVAFGAIMIKTGVAGGERLAKLNELIRLEESYSDLRILPIRHFGSIEANIEK